MNQFEILLQAVEGNVPVQTVTLIAGPVEQSAELGQMLIIFTPERIEGSIIDGNFTEKVVLELSKQEWNQPCILTISYQQAEYQVFWNRIINEKNRTFILGGGHISQPLVQILSILEYEITVVDDRFEFANAKRFPGAQQVVCDSYIKVLQEFEPDAKTAVIIVTRGHQYDLDCLRSVIGTKAGYIGMIGSRRKVEATLQVLRQEGISQHLLDRVRAPIGLDLGGQKPEEVAVSIAAEVVAVFKGGSCLPLRDLRKGVNHG
ncbi:MAG: XdhC family protein [Sporomusaceae bacterium]|nr:XdhC family protein [Sporomusaceae bacterium]